MKPHLELISHELNSSIHTFVYENDHYATPWHYHQEYELTFVQKGSGIRYIGNHIDDFYPGDMVLLGSSLPHCWKNDRDYRGGVVSICIQWNHGILNRFIAESVELHKIQSLLKHAQYGVKIGHRKADGIAEKLNKLIVMSPARKLLAFLDLLLELSQLPDNETLSGVKEVLGTHDLQSDNRIEQLVEYIDNHYHQKISIKEMASLTFMTEVSFCKFFKRRFHKSFTNYLNEYRIRKACQMLRERDRTLSDIAISCGYENMSFFHRQFKKYMGVTPKVYRR